MKVPYYTLSPQLEIMRSELHAAAARAIDSGMYIMGEELSSFEKAFAKYTSAKHCIGVNSGLDALTIALEALGMGEGDEVIVPANTFVATALAVVHCGAKPVFCEVDAQTNNIDTDKIDTVISSKTKAIIAVHLYGRICDMDALSAIAQKHDLQIVEDNAQAHGARSGDKKTGSFGIINCTSFYPAKNLGAMGDGGAITTDDKALAKKCESLRNYGSTEKYVHDIIGHNSRLDEMQAAILSVKLKYLDALNAQRVAIATKYHDTLKGLSQITLPEMITDGSHVYHIFSIHIDARDRLQQHLKENGIQTLIHYPTPLHLQPCFEHLGYKKGDFPIAEKLAATELSLPIYPGMTDEQIAYVSEKIRSFYR